MVGVPPAGRFHRRLTVSRRNGALTPIGSLDVSPDASIDDSDITDDELTELALAADRDAPLAEDAVPIDVHLARFGAALPLWYMPPVARSGGGRWRAPVVLAVVSAFALIDAMGLCNTYGILSLA